MLDRQTPSAFGTRLRTLRMLYGLSTRRMARLAKTGPAVIYQLERGLIQRPNAELALRITSVLGASTEYMVLGDGDPPTNDVAVAAIQAATDADAALRKAMRSPTTTTSPSNAKTAA